MKRLFTLTAAAGALVVAACQNADVTSSAIAPRSVARTLGAGTATIDPALATQVAAASPAEQLIVLATYDELSADPLAVTQGILRTGAGVIRFKNLPVIAALATPAQIDAMQFVAGVEGLWANKKVDYTLRESRVSIKADQVHLAGITGKGVGVAILDSGIDGLNPALTYPTKTVANVKVIVSIKDLFTFGDDPTLPKLAGQLVVENLANSETGQMGHGTHVAGIVGADSTSSTNGIYKGVAPGARLIGIATGEGPFIFYVLAGFDWLLEHRTQYNIRVVNNSWGTSGDFDPKDPTNIATKKVHDAGVTVVFAAGNCGSGGSADCRPAGENQLNPYSVAPWVIGVAAGCKWNVAQDPTNSVAVYCADSLGRNVLADFSSRGVPGSALYHPTLTAPGVRIVSTRASTGTIINALDANSDVRRCNSSVPNLVYYTCASGTSMASPHVAGVAALLLEANPRLTPDQIKQVLVKTATPLPAYQAYEVGAGFMNAYAAYRAVR